ncbi:hypothetical protein ANTPLA_LOCUS9158 [Anthophora plagiata]
MAAPAQLKSLIKTRAIIKGNVTRLIGYFSDNADVDIDDIQTRKVKLEECYQAFSNTQLEIEILVEETQVDSDQELERARFDEQYFKCAKIINQRLRVLSASQATSEPGTPTSHSGSARNSNITINHGNTLLPKIEIRPFDGNPIEWYSFHDTFQSLVHNDPNIPAVQKFYLLKNSLHGSVATIIEPLTASEENYKVAWDLLKQRCDRPRQIIQTHIRAILELPEVTKESPLNIRALKEAALMHVNALKALKEPVEMWNSILTYIIVRKLDKNTRRAWERSLENMQMPKFAELIEFLSKQERGDESEICSSTIGNQIQIKLEKHANKVGKSSSHRGQSFVGTQTRNECNFCNSNHSIYACEKFLKLNPRERSNAARSKRLCINCLRNNHPTNKCYAPGCKTCHRKHNTLLHFIESHAQTRIEESSKRDSNSSSSTDQVKQGYTVTYDSEVLLGTARVKILDRYNKEHECRVLLDGCSQGHFISENLAQKLQLNKERIDLPFAGLGQLTTRAEYRVRTIIKSKNNNFQSEAEFIALPKITSMLPSRRVNRKEPLIPQNIKWLVQNENKWKIKQLADMVIPEQRVKAALLVTERNVAVPGSSVELNTRDAAENEQNTKSDTFERISSIDRLIRFVAFCRRAVSNRKVEFKTSGKYTIEELKRARLQIIRVIQQKHFSRDIKNLKEGIPLNSKGKLICLNPFLDSDGVIRVGGRLTNAQIAYSRKYSILLPHNDHVTNLIIRNEHIKHWHAGVQATLNAVRYNYWPIDGKNITRHIIHKCVRCSKLNPKLQNYTMGDLPKNRVIHSRPFTNVGLDYCGPFLLKEKKFRNKGKIKSYVAVFVCFTTRAVHLELVTDLTTETCLEAIKRFCARRGKPTNVYSDNATNFIGVKNEILKVRAFFMSNENNTKLSNYFQNEGINWHFIPPRSPHFGGLWEAAVRSFKHHLYRTVGEAMFTYEQFNTCIVEIESILNSRPLTPLSSDPNDLIALTPAHFLIGDSLPSFPEIDLQDVPINRLSTWQRVQKVKQHFWKRWHKEYLNELRTRSKWHQGNGVQIKIGQLVMIKEDNLPPMQWSMGRIVAVHPGADNIVRVATVKTQTGVYKRCVKKLAPLPIDRPTDN